MVLCVAKIIKLSPKNVEVRIISVGEEILKEGTTIKLNLDVGVHGLLVKELRSKALIIKICDGCIIEVGHIEGDYNFSPGENIKIMLENESKNVFQILQGK